MGFASYHNHSVWSDGGDTLEAMLAACAAAGLDEAGLSDHYGFYPGPPQDWSMRRDRLPDYLATLGSLRGSYGPLQVRVGLEVDYFPETFEETREALSGVEADYLIGSVHFVGDFPVDAASSWWEALSRERIDEVWRTYFALIRAMAATRFFDFVGHLDLPKKYGYRPDADMSGEIMATLDALSAAGMAMEINTAGRHLPAGEVYPDPWILAEARRREVPILINADAHRAAHVTRSFDIAAGLAHAAGYTHLARYRRRERTAVPLP
ncbi:MAG: histidinol-phosphatase [Armatimonadetes bacterium]|nr:histidinol-phosphatase [Armatimonadota bacterium]